MKFFYIISTLPLALSATVDCSMSQDSTRCDCIHVSKDRPTGTLSGTDCRVCRLNGIPFCALWGSGVERYGPLCEDKKCPAGKSWKDGIAGGEGGCYCEWEPKEHERAPCPVPAGDCKCSHVIYNGTSTTTATLPGETCTLCPPTSNGPYFCTETGNKKNGWFDTPVCMGKELGPDCTGRDCVCNWMMTMEGVGWRNVTKEEKLEIGSEERGTEAEVEVES